MFIQLVDNNKFYASVLTELLHNAGFKSTRHASGGNEFISKVVTREIPDVLIIDESNCFEGDVDIIKESRNIYPGLTVIVLTGSEMRSNVTSNPEDGSIHFLAKESVTIESLPELLYNIFTNKIGRVKKTPRSRVFSLLRKPLAEMLNF